MTTETCQEAGWVALASQDGPWTDDVQARVEEIAARLNAAHAELVTLTAEVIRDDLWGGGGVRSVEHWLVLRAGLSPVRSRDIALLARRSLELPMTVSSLSSAELSIDQAVVVARHTPAAYDQSVRDFAIYATVPQLRAVLPHYAFEDLAVHPLPTEARDTSDAADATAPAELSMRFVDDGRFRLVFTASADLGALVERAVREAKDSLFTAGQPTATLADGLVEVANRSLSSLDGSPRANRYRIYLHVDTGRFAAPAPARNQSVAPAVVSALAADVKRPRGRGWLNRGPALPQVLVDLYTCDGLIRPIWEKDGVPVSVGRSQRIVPARTRRLVEDRDRGCRFPGCSATGFVENHHLDHWRDGGRTVLDRLVSLCPYHHRQHHLGAFSIDGTPVRSSSKPDGLVFRDRFGAHIGAWPPGPPARSSPPHGGSPGAAPGAAGVSAASSSPRSNEGKPPLGEPRYVGPAGERFDPGWVWFAPSG